MAKVSPSLEDYLETIYFLRREKSTVRLTDVAQSLGLSKPSASKAISILGEKGYVSHERYGSDLTLTEKGLEIAQSVAGRHIVLTRFLKDLLGIDESDANDEACKIEHHLSAETVDRLRQYLDENIGKQ